MLENHDHPSTPLTRARDRMIETGQWSSAQTVGRRTPIGCVALEITQRCNLDCSACYLSEHSEAVKDLPLEEIFRRVDLIREFYGSDVDVQITGGDPTLRKLDELTAIVRRIRDAGMRPALFTNGIRATRELLARLAENGLVDVAFHVDMTQRRRGYSSETELNRLRLDYINRARGLPLAVYFNTTVFDGNIHEIPSLVEFFIRHSDVVRLASFQPVAETGRGKEGLGATEITTGEVIHKIELGAGTSLSFDTAHAGHVLCNRYAMAFIVAGKAIDALNDRSLYNSLVSRTALTRFDRRDPRRAIFSFLFSLGKNPDLALRVLFSAFSKVWTMKRSLISARGRVTKLSFFIHNFMDACQLDPDRIKACIFTVATEDGPVSMCQFNAQRDQSILRPVKIRRGGEDLFWNPLAGSIHKEEPEIEPATAASYLQRRAARRRGENHES